MVKSITQLLELLCLHFCGVKDIFMETTAHVKIVNRICAPEAPTLKVVHRLHCSSSNKNIWITVEMEHKFHEAIKN